MAEPGVEVAAGRRLPALRGPGGRRLRVAHLTTVDMSLVLLLGTELTCDVAAGLDTVGLSAPGPYLDRLAALGVRHVPVPALTRAWRPTDDLRAVGQLWRALRRLRPDVLHTHNPKTGVLGRVLGRLAGVPVVVNTCHGLWAAPGDRWLVRRLVAAVEGTASRFSHAELFQNAEDQRTLARWLPAGRSTVVGNGVDLDRFRPDPAARARTRAALGVAPAELLVGGVGRLVAEKGIGELVEAAGRLGSSARFVWAGPADETKPDAVRVGAGPVRFLGEWRDTASLYNALDVFVLPSYREGFSRSAMEAAACGLPMVLSDIRGCREVGTDGEHLLLVPAADAEALHDALARLLADAALRRRLGAAARSRAVVEFDQRRVARASLDAYLAVATRRGLGWEVDGAPVR